MAAPKDVQVARAFVGISAHPQFSALEEKYQRLALNLAQKAEDLEGHDIEEFAVEFSAYTQKATGGSPPVTVFNFFQKILTDAKPKVSKAETTKVVEKKKEPRKVLPPKSEEAGFAESRIIAGQGRLPGFPPAPPPSFDALLSRANEVADGLDEHDCSAAAEELMSAVQSVTEDMTEGEVVGLFLDSYEAMVACEDALPDEEGFEGQWTGYNEVVNLTQRFVSAPQESDEEDYASPDAISAEVGALREAAPPAENVVGLAAAVVALAHEANRTTLYHFTELAKQTKAAGAPALAAQFLKMLTHPPSLAPMPPDLGRNMGIQAAKVADTKYGLSGPSRAEIATAFATSHPSSVIASLNGIFKGLIESRVSTKGTFDSLTAAAITSFDEGSDTKARSQVFDILTQLAKVLADAGASPAMPTKIIGVKEGQEPADIIAAGSDPETVLAEAEAASGGYVAPPETTAPAPIDTTTEDQGPSVQTAVPTQGELITLIAGVNGDSEKAKLAIEANYAGWYNKAKVKAAFKVWLTGLITQPNSSFGILWTDAPGSADLTEGGVFERTHRISGAPDSNQAPNAALWRQVGVPVENLSYQELAYINAGGIVKTNRQYQSQFAGASLQGPPEDEVDLVPGETKRPLYFYTDFVSRADFGEGIFFLNTDAYQAVLECTALNVERNPDTDGIRVSDGFGTVSLTSNTGGEHWISGSSRDRADAGWLSGALSEILGFLAVLEELGVARCGSSKCVSEILCEMADKDGATVETLAQGTQSLASRWKVNFSNTFAEDVDTFTAKVNPEGLLVVTMAAGPESYRTQAVVKARVKDNGSVEYGIKVVVAGETRFRWEASMSYRKFIYGSALASKLANEAANSEYGDFGVPEKVVTISGDALSSSVITSMLDAIREKASATLDETAKSGILLANGAPKAPAKKKKKKGAQPRA